VKRRRGYRDLEPDQFGSKQEGDSAVVRGDAANGEASLPNGPDGGPSLIMQSVRVATGDAEERRHAFLVYADDALIAVLAQPEHAVAKEFGKTWVLHAGFGPCSGSGPKVWHDLGEFHHWITDRLRPPEAVSARGERTMTHRVTVWRVFDHPAEHPETCVAREFEVLPQQESRPTGYVIEARRWRLCRQSCAPTWD
jgi:hypothetical protein